MLVDVSPPAGGTLPNGLRAVNAHEVRLVTCRGAVRWHDLRPRTCGYRAVRMAKAQYLLNTNVEMGTRVAIGGIAAM